MCVIVQRRDGKVCNGMNILQHSSFVLVVVVVVVVIVSVSIRVTVLNVSNVIAIVVTVIEIEVVRDVGLDRHGVELLIPGLEGSPVPKGQQVVVL